MNLSKIAPKNFLCRFPLQGGSLFVGSVTLILAIISVIVVAVEIVSYKKCEDCTVMIMHNAYSFSINAILYCVLMIFVNFWFLWGVKRRKSPVVLSWVVITSLWWLQSFILVFILLCMSSTESSIGWIVALVCAIIAFMVFGYFISVVYGYWLEIRPTPLSPPLGPE